MARVIAIANQKGGVGKTTTVINLSACLAERNIRVLIIDIDPQANATSGLGLAKVEGGSIYPVLLGETTLREQIRSTEIERLHIVPGEVDLAGAEVDIARTDNYLFRLRACIEDVTKSDDYDVVFIDCPPSLGILTMNALVAAHTLMLPIQCEYYALEGLSVMQRLIQQLREGGANPWLDIEGIVMTMYDGRTNLAQQVVEEVRNHFQDKVYETLIPRSIRLSEAPSFGESIIQYADKSAGATAYRLLAKEFIERIQREYETQAEDEETTPDENKTETENVEA